MNDKHVPKPVYKKEFFFFGFKMNKKYAEWNTVVAGSPGYYTRSRYSGDKIADRKGFGRDKFLKSTGYY